MSKSISNVGAGLNPEIASNDQLDADDSMTSSEPELKSVGNVHMFSSAGDDDSVVIGLLSGSDESLFVGLNPDDAAGDDAGAAVIMSDGSADLLSGRAAFTSGNFSEEMLENNLDADKNDLLDLQKEWEEEQERIAEEEAEREAEEERLVEEALERERERKAEEEAEREREQQEEAEREEAEQAEAEREREEQLASEQESSSNSPNTSSGSSGSSRASNASSSASGNDDDGFVRGSPRDGCAGWGELVEEHFGEGEYDKACSVLVCESEGDPEAQNPVSTASGLFQFLDTTWVSVSGHVGAGEHERAMYATPEQQAEGAKILRDNYGWSQWVCQ